ncbi:MAG: hypothetical protein LUE31_03045 [Lachnospiraceae bacterium]|nr:hypothetical protein [Lachnospiraceae bacterium]
MSDDFTIEVFSPDFTFRSKKRIQRQKYEYDYMSFGENELKIPGVFEADKWDYIRLITDQGILSGIITAKELSSSYTVIRYRDLMSLLDIDVYRERSLLADESLEAFLGGMIEENYISNEDSLQNVPGLSIEYLSETVGATMNLTDNIHNIYDLALKALKKYGVVIDMTLDVMAKSVICRIGTREQDTKYVEADLKNIISVDIVLQDTDESVNKVIVVGEYSEDDERYGETLVRTYYLDAETGETTMEPTSRVEPVVFQYATISINEETFEDDAYETAYDAMYSEECDNAIKVEVVKNDALYRPTDFTVGQKCIIIKSGVRYSTVFTGWNMDSTVKLLFGMIRTEYTKRRNTNVS